MAKTTAKSASKSAPKTAPKKPEKPSVDTIASIAQELRDKNREALRQAGPLAREAFGTDRPTIEMLTGVSALLAGDIEPHEIVPNISGAKRRAADLGLNPSPTDVFDVLDILLDSPDFEEAERNLADAKAEAVRTLGGSPSVSDVIEVYRQIYDVEEELAAELYDRFGVDVDASDA